jgi:S1-C subfamily serine protease
MKRAFQLGVLGCLVALATSGIVPVRLGTPLAAQSQPMIRNYAAPTSSSAPAGDSLLALSDRLEAISGRVLPAVVSVEAVKPGKTTANGGKSRPVEESGSGVIIKIDGRQGYFVLTNNHVIAQATTDNITIHLADGRILRPGRIWADPETDVAFMSLDGALDLPTARLGNSDNARVGRVVLAMGSPFGLNQTVTHGIISARDRGQVSLGNTIRIKDFLQTDAAINPGSSGGPLVDLQGEVIGINTAIASPSGSNTGVAFSIPVNLVKRVMVQMLNGGSVQRGFLGAQLAQTLEPAEALRLGMNRVQGALVERVYPNTPAASADLRPLDVILQLDQVSIRNENHFINLVSALPPGQRVRMQVWRSRSLVTVEAVVGDWNQSQSRFRE